MTAKVTYFPVANGDMTLIQIEEGTRNDPMRKSILVDCKLDMDGGANCDVVHEFRTRLPIDEKGRPFVDVFCLTHPDQDHILGFEKHFHTGPIADYKDENALADRKIYIKEMWSSPIVFRRAKRQKEEGESFCPDAQAWQKEAKRRVKLWRQDNAGKDEVGNQLKLFGKDCDNNGENKNADLEDITVLSGGDTFCAMELGNGSQVEIKTLGPLDHGGVDGDEEEASLAKNRSSIIVQALLYKDSGQADPVRLLLGGDAAVTVWEKLWETFGDDADDRRLEYDILLAPHHCSWRSLSHGSWSDCEEKGDESCKVSEDAESALSQARKGAYILSSSWPVKGDDGDPPSIGAKRRYVKIVKSDRFLCTGETPNEKNPRPIEFLVEHDGVVKNTKAASAAAAVSVSEGAMSETAGHG